MDFQMFLDQKKMSKYHLSKISGVPKTTIMDICAGRSDIDRCSAKTVQQLARALDCTMEDIMALAPAYDSRTGLPKQQAWTASSTTARKRITTIPQNAGAYYDQDQQVIFVRRGMEPHDIFRSVSKELAHAELAQQDPNSSRSQNSFAAYCASYLLCKKYGVDVGGYNFSRLPEDFTQGDAQFIRNTLTQVRDAASDISARMARSMEQSRSAKPKSKER